MEKQVEKLIIPGVNVPRRKRVAAYARVSSGKDAMLRSLSAQVSAYSSLIQKTPGWQFVKVYADEAITGTKNSRTGFLQMLTDCRAGLIDIVLCKSISRFARNTVTLLEAVRELKDLGVDVYFEEQNIHTMSGDGELMLTILASYAQEESRSVSENMKWRIKKNFEEGMPWNGTLLGYRYKEGQYVIEPQEADTVRRIFSLFLDGKGVRTIAKMLNAESVPTRYRNSWSKNSIMRVLRNYSYTGNLLLQKTFREDYLTKRDVKNRGQKTQYHAVGTHEAIISLDDYNAVQVEILRRAERYAPPTKNYTKRYPYSGLISCGCCGARYCRKITHGGPVWICTTFNTQGKAACPSKQIPESVLDDLTTEISLTDLTAIRAENGNKLVFCFKNGSESVKRWKDRSRAESWTPEMKERARQREKQRQEAIHNGNS
ncbi:MAG: recombinase family protein [Oscillospiraceae bacterium]|nr:recombinase family protein [Oscillospiraceae bacterium]